MLIHYFLFRQSPSLAGRRANLSGEIGLSCSARHQFADRPTARSKATEFMHRRPTLRASHRRVQ